MMKEWNYDIFRDEWCVMRGVCVVSAWCLRGVCVLSACCCVLCAVCCVLCAMCCMIYFIHISKLSYWFQCGVVLIGRLIIPVLC